MLLPGHGQFLRHLRGCFARRDARADAIQRALRISPVQRRLDEAQKHAGGRGAGGWSVSGWAWVPMKYGCMPAGSSRICMIGWVGWLAAEDQAVLFQHGDVLGIDLVAVAETQR